jgi:hypothetical protein
MISCFRVRRADQCAALTAQQNAQFGNCSNDWSLFQMLEHSSSAMAEDLINKSKLIQHYCMEGKASGQFSSRDKQERQ